MKVVLKIFFATFIAAAWYHLNGPDQAFVAIILFILIILITFIKPIKYQDPKERDEYRNKMLVAKERQMALKQKQMQEKILIKQQAKEAEEVQKRELKRKLKI